MPRIQHSTASGQPDHLAASTVPGVIDGMGRPFPPLPESQRPPARGINLPLDPVLEAAGAYWNDKRELVRAWRIHGGPAEEIKNAQGVVVKRVQKFWTRERYVAPPGMSIEDARARGLDFFSPVYGWIRGGVKREMDSSENLGSGPVVGDFEYEETAPDGSPLVDAAPVAV